MEMETPATAAPSAPAPEPARIGAIGRMAGALFSPGETFADIARVPSWVAPVLLYVALGLIVTAVFTQRVGWENFMRNRMERSSRFADLPQDQKDRQVQMAAKVAPFTTVIGVVVFNIGGTLLVAAVLMGLFRVTSGAEVKFKQALGVVAHAYMPLAVSAVLGIVIMFLKDPTQVDLENLVASNADAFIAGDSPRWLHSLGQSIDLFPFWVIFLLGVGFSAINPKKIKMGGALGIVIGAWLAYVLVKVGLTAAFS